MGSPFLSLLTRFYLVPLQLLGTLRKEFLKNSGPCRPQKTPFEGLCCLSACAGNTAPPFWWVGVLTKGDLGTKRLTKKTLFGTESTGIAFSPGSLEYEESPCV